MPIRFARCYWHVETQAASTDIRPGARGVVPSPGAVGRSGHPVLSALRRPPGAFSRTMSLSVLTTLFVLTEHGRPATISK
jgi:hypothetical protein